MDTQIDLMVEKIRSLIEDFPTKDFEVFSYTNSNVWTLSEPNIMEIVQVLINGNPLLSGEGFTYNKENNKLTVTGVTFSLGDIVEVDYVFHKYSRKNIIKYILGALTWLSIGDYSANSYKIIGTTGNEVIVPDLEAPANKTADLIVIITSILILPNYMHYRMPNLAINYPEKECKEDKIRHIIERYKQGVGIVDIIQWNRSPGL